MSEIHDKALQIVKTKGPLIPVEVAKEIGNNIMMTSAILSELVSKNQIKLSSVKVGGTPLYYVEEQKVKLQEFSKHLHEKEQKAYELLKEKKVLKDNDQPAVIRVALRNIKDYAKPMEAITKGVREMFWKWYLFTDDEAKRKILEILGQSPKENKVKKVKKPEAKPKKISEPTVKEEHQRSVEEKSETPKDTPKPTDDFLRSVHSYFSKNDIEVISQNVIRKNSEADFMVEIPSNVGRLKYYCKAKAKKKCNDGDLSSAYIQGQMKKLPVLFLGNDLTKKAEKMLSTEFSSMTFKKL